MSRIVRIKSLLMQEISKIIQQKFRQNLGLISIVDMNMCKRFGKNATVYYSHFGSENEQKNHMKS